MEAETIQLNSLSPRRMVHLGLFLIILAVVALWNVVEARITSADLFLSLGLLGVGTALVTTQLSNLSFAKICAVIGGATLSFMIVVAIFLAGVIPQLSRGVERSLVIPETYTAQALQILFDQTWDIVLGAEPKAEQKLPESISTELKNTTLVALARSAKDSLVVGSFLATVWFVMALVLLPERKLRREDDSVFADIRQLTVEYTTKLQDELLAIDHELTRPWTPALETEPQTA